MKGWSNACFLVFIEAQFDMHWLTRCMCRVYCTLGFLGLAPESSVMRCSSLFSVLASVTAESRTLGNIPIRGFDTTSRVSHGDCVPLMRPTIHHRPSNSSLHLSDSRYQHFLQTSPFTAIPPLLFLPGLFNSRISPWSLSLALPTWIPSSPRQ